MGRVTSTAESPASHASPILQLARSILQLIAIVAVTVWGFVAWPLPFPGVLTGLGFLVLSVLLWALFLSPRPVLNVDRFAEALFELLLIAAAVAALLFMGVFWVIPAVYGVAAAIVGYIASARTR